jgi:hypothetical protein
MATHYTCDVCGDTIPWLPPQKEFLVTFTVDGWRSAEGVKELVLRGQIVGQFDEGPADAPDLCQSCCAHILRQAAFVLDPEPTQRPIGILEDKR